MLMHNAKLKIYRDGITCESQNMCSMEDDSTSFCV